MSDVRDEIVEGMARALDVGDLERVIHVISRAEALAGEKKENPSKKGKFHYLRCPVCEAGFRVPKEESHLPSHRGWGDRATAPLCEGSGQREENPAGLTAKGERMYEHVKESYGSSPRASEIAARTVLARAAEGAPGLKKNPNVSAKQLGARIKKRLQHEIKPRPDVNIVRAEESRPVRGWDQTLVFKLEIDSVGVFIQLNVAPDESSGYVSADRMGTISTQRGSSPEVALDRMVSDLVSHFGRSHG